MTVTSPVAADDILHGDCVELLRELPNDSVDMVFADPPFNIGFEYDQYHDDHADDDYIAWCRDWMLEVLRVLKPGAAFWLAIGDEFAADLRVEAHRNVGFVPRNWVIWYYTFGQNCKRKFNRSHVHLFHFTKEADPAVEHTFNAQDPLVRVPSARALVYGDKRANPTGRLPDDTWILRPQDLRDQPEALQPMDDTWYFSRVAGTFKERQGFHGCQMPEQLLGRILRISSNPGDLVLDPFSGSGTTLAVAKKLGRHWLGFDLSEDYVTYANERLANSREGDPLSGPADPASSSPTTAAGRRLKDHPLLPTFEPEDFEPELKAAAQQEAVAEVVEAAPAPAPPAVSSPPANTDVAPAPALKLPSLRELQRQTLIDAFLATHEGFSVDWMLCDPDLQEAFHKTCRAAGLIGRPGDWNRELLKLRKAGLLKRDDPESDNDKHGWLKKVEFSAESRDAFAFAGEIAWGELQRKFPHWSLDALLCSPGKAYLFDRAAARYVKGQSPAEMRWAALRLRKARHALAAEAKQYHFVLHTRDFGRFNPWGRFRANKLDGQPGLYLLRNQSKAPVYLGETLDLGRRLAMHAATSAPGRAVTQVSIILSDELPSNDYREPLWWDLVQRYQPKLNLPALEQSKAEKK